MTEYNARAVVLAAGKSTRFKTKKSKLLFNICGQSMILYPLRLLEQLNIPISLVLGYQGDAVQAEVEQAQVKNVTYVTQQEQLGTGHAVACTQRTWDKDHIIVMNGDMPLVSTELIQNLMDDHIARNSTVTFLTSYVIDPAGYGRVIEDTGKIYVVEEKDCTDEQRNINCINAGMYVMKRSFLETYIHRLHKSEVTAELYVPDLIRLACDAGLPVRALSIPYDTVRGINTLQELWGVEQVKRSEFIKHWMAQGVRFELAQSIHIDMNVEIGAGSFIGTGVHLLGKTKIGEECFVGAFSIVEDTTIDDGSTIHSHSVIQKSMIGKGVHAGPFARLRENVVLGDGSIIGNFVEVKNVVLGQSTKVKHLTYLGDAQIGENVNIGAGTIICNYDGTKKEKTTVEDNVFIGSNNTLVAPLVIEKDSYTAAGSTITQNVPEGSLAIARSRQTNKQGYAQKLKKSKIQKNDDENNSEKSVEYNQEKEDQAFQFHGAIKTETDHKLGF